MCGCAPEPDNGALADMVDLLYAKQDTARSRRFRRSRKIGTKRRALEDKRVLIFCVGGSSLEWRIHETGYTLVVEALRPPRGFLALHRFRQSPRARRYGTSS